MRRSKLLLPGARVGIAVSGGPDSMLLLDFALTYAREVGFAVSAVHFNHRLRSEESDADEAFVRAHAEQLGLPVFCSAADVAATARSAGRNLEAVARDLRYRFFFSLVREGKLDLIATAHTANDQAETVLLRLIRGTGTRGLGGIHPALAGGVVRPFLMLTRSDVEAEIGRRGFAYRVDGSNADPRFTRNRLRERILPLLESDFNANVVTSLAGFADRAREDEAFLEDQARERARAWIRREGHLLKIPARRLEGFPPAIARRVLRQMVAEAAQRRISRLGPISIRHSEIEALRRLAADGQSGRLLSLSPGVEARLEFEWLIMTQQKAKPDQGRTVTENGAASRSGYSYAIDPPGSVAIPELRLRLIFNFANAGDADEPEGEYTDKREGVWLKSVNLAAPLTLRTRRAGDRIRLKSHATPVKLKEMFRLRRIPESERAYWPILESAGEIIWAWGIGFAHGLSTGSGNRLMIREQRLQPDADQWPGDDAPSKELDKRDVTTG